MTTLSAVSIRKNLVPLWIKIFGWIFIAMGIAVPALPIVIAFTGALPTLEIFGLHHQGSLLHPMALLISAIVLCLAASAYGLLFGKSWGLMACLITGYGGVAICLSTMVYSIFASSTLTIRLELLVHVPFLLRLHKIKPIWPTAV